MSKSDKTYSPEKPKKPVRSISGVMPLTVVLKPRKCDHGTCIYCPGGEYVPQSYTDKSPAIMRALALKFDPYEQVMNRLTVLKKMGHPTDKIEIIVLGGTFLQYELDYQYEFIKRCFDALNGIKAKDLEEAKKINDGKSEISRRPSIEELKKQLKESQLKNETAEHRCVALCIENRPDNCSPKEIKRMLEFGTTRIEIGVQLPDDYVYKKINRGHSVKDVVEATERLKNAGFKVGYHFMPGLPYSNPKKDLELFKMIFDDERFRPDQLKIYPCQIVKDSPLEKSYKILDYTSYTTQQTKELLQKMFPLIPNYCRIMRVMREIPKEKMMTEPIKLDLRRDVEESFKKQGIKIKEIRMREIGFNESGLGELKLKTTSYPASNGEEYFLEIVNEKDILFGLLRLRIFGEGSFPPPAPRPPTPQDISFQTFKPTNLQQDSKAPEIVNVNNQKKFRASESSEQFKLDKSKLKNKKAIIRELHVYGKTLNLGDKGNISQHKGVGKWLMGEAEGITKRLGVKKLAVISGIGVREYYKKLGYSLEEPYVVKEL